MPRHLTRRLSGELDGCPHTVRDEDELDLSFWYRPRRSVRHHALP
jgi:hypothetical protein